MKLFDFIRKNTGPEKIEGFQPHGAEAFAYLCPLCQRRITGSEVCNKCRMEEYPGFIPDVNRVKRLMDETYRNGDALYRISEILEEIHKQQKKGNRNNG